MTDPTPTPAIPVPPYTVPCIYRYDTYWAYRHGYETGFSQASPERLVTPTPGAPVPPRQVLQQCSEDFFSDDSDMRSTEFGFRHGAAWGHAQAMQEREELIKLLTDSANVAESYAAQSSPSYGTVALDQHAKKCRAAAERLSPSAQEKND
jgi:hypothetical protein